MFLKTTLLLSNRALRWSLLSRIYSIRNDEVRVGVCMHPGRSVWPFSEEGQYMSRLGPKSQHRTLTLSRSEGLLRPIWRIEPEVRSFIQSEELCCCGDLGVNFSVIIVGVFLRVAISCEVWESSEEARAKLAFPVWRKKVRGNHFCVALNNLRIGGDRYPVIRGIHAMGRREAIRSQLLNFWGASTLLDYSKIAKSKRKILRDLLEVWNFTRWIIVAKFLRFWGRVLVLALSKVGIRQDTATVYQMLFDLSTIFCGLWSKILNVAKVLSVSGFRIEDKVSVLYSPELAEVGEEIV